MSMYGSLASVSTGRELGRRVRNDVVPPDVARRRSRARPRRCGAGRGRRARSARAAIASSATAFMGTVLPRRKAPSAVMSRLASPSRRREASASAPKPENIGRKMAPSLPRARTAITVSGSIGMKTPTRSPALDAQVAQGIGQPVRLQLQLAEGEAAHLAVVALPDQGGALAVRPCGVAVEGAGDVVEAAAGEPLRPGRAPREIEHLLVRPAPDELEILGDRPPVPGGVRRWRGPAGRRRRRYRAAP